MITPGAAASAAIPGEFNIRIVVPEETEIDGLLRCDDWHDDFKVSVALAYKVTLNNASSTGDVGRDSLATQPRKLNVRMVVPEVPKFHGAIECPQRDHDFKNVRGRR